MHWFKALWLWRADRQPGRAEICRLRGHLSSTVGPSAAHYHAERSWNMCNLSEKCTLVKELFKNSLKNAEYLDYECAIESGRVLMYSIWNNTSINTSLMSDFPPLKTKPLTLTAESCLVSCKNQSRYPGPICLYYGSLSSGCVLQSPPSFLFFFRSYFRTVVIYYPICSPRQIWEKPSSGFTFTSISRRSGEQAGHIRCLTFFCTSLVLKTNIYSCVNSVLRQTDAQILGCKPHCVFSEMSTA